MTEQKQILILKGKNIILPTTKGIMVGARPHQFVGSLVHEILDLINEPIRTYGVQSLGNIYIPGHSC